RGEAVNAARDVAPFASLSRGRSAEAVAGPQRALDGGVEQSVGERARRLRVRSHVETTAPPRPRRADVRQLALVAEALAHQAVQIAKAVDQTEFGRLAPGPDLPFEQFLVGSLQPVAPACPHRAFEVA